MSRPRVWWSETSSRGSRASPSVPPRSRIGSLAWEQQLPAIGASYRAISYSRRYARPNDDISEGVDDQMLVHVEDLAAFLSAVGATPAHLVGNSWGAFICLLSAIRYPELVRTLALEEPPVIPLVLGAGATAA